MTVQECIVLAQARNEEEDRRSHARVFPLNIIVPCEAARKRQAPLRRKVASARVQCERVKKQRIARLSDKVYLLEAFHSKFHPFWLRSLLVPTPPFQTPTPIVSYIQRHNTRGESGRRRARSARNTKRPYPMATWSRRPRWFEPLSNLMPAQVDTHLRLCGVETQRTSSEATVARRLQIGVDAQPFSIV